MSFGENFVDHVTFGNNDLVSQNFALRKILLSFLAEFVQRFPDNGPFFLFPNENLPGFLFVAFLQFLPTFLANKTF